MRERTQTRNRAEFWSACSNPNSCASIFPSDHRSVYRAQIQDTVPRRRENSELPLHCQGDLASFALIAVQDERIAGRTCTACLSLRVFRRRFAQRVQALRVSDKSVSGDVAAELSLCRPGPESS